MLENFMIDREPLENDLNNIFIRGKRIQKDTFELLIKAKKKGINLFPYVETFGNDTELLQEIYLGLLSKVDVSIYAKKEYIWETMRKIREALEKKLDISMLDASFNCAQIGAYIDLISYGLDIKPILNNTLAENQIRFLGKLLLEKKDISIYFKEDGSHYNFEKMKQIKKLAEIGFDFNEINLELLCPQQLREIRMGFYSKINYKLYNNHAYPHGLMKMIRSLLELEIEIPEKVFTQKEDMLETLANLKKDYLKQYDYLEDELNNCIGEDYKDKYDENQIYQIKKVITKGYDLNVLLKENYSAEQMEELVFGLEDDLDVNKYSDIKLTDTQMSKIRNELLIEKENMEYIDNFRKDNFKSKKKRKYPLKNLHKTKEIMEREIAIQKQNTKIKVFVYFDKTLQKIFEEEEVVRVDSLVDKINNFVPNLDLDDEEFREHLEMLQQLLELEN